MNLGGRIRVRHCPQFSPHGQDNTCFIVWFSISLWPGGQTCGHPLSQSLPFPCSFWPCHYEHIIHILFHWQLFLNQPDPRAQAWAGGGHLWAPWLSKNKHSVDDGAVVLLPRHLILSQHIRAKNIASCWGPKTQGAWLPTCSPSAVGASLSGKLRLLKINWFSNLNIVPCLSEDFPLCNAI